MFKVGSIGSERRVLNPMAAAVLGLCGLAALVGPGGAAAGTDNVIETVNQTSDEPDANTADNTCDTDLGTGGAQCTLRAAIQQANAYAGTDADLIRFNIPGDGVHRIAPDAPLPGITGETEIDGYSQPGASVNTRKLRQGDNAKLLIELSGENLDPFSDNGLMFVAGSSDSQVKGLCINRFATGIVLQNPARVAGNFIGTDPTGTKDRGNLGDGVFASSSIHPSARIIGGSTPEARNVISANGRSAIISNIAATVQGNYIGTASDGRSPLGNRGESMTEATAAVELASDTIGNTVGGPGDAANVIAFNEHKGVSVYNPNTVAYVTRNRIHSNGGLAIDLGDDGRTPNDADDADPGPNRLLNFPVLKRATSHAGHTRIAGVLKTFPTTAPYGIEFFANPQGGRQAKRFIGTVLVETNGNGKADFNFKARPTGPGATITATTNDDGGATSELSATIEVEAP